MYTAIEAGPLAEPDILILGLVTHELLVQACKLHDGGVGGELRYRTATGARHHGIEIEIEIGG